MSLEGILKRDSDGSYNLLEGDAVGDRVSRARHVPKIGQWVWKLNGDVGSIRAGRDFAKHGTLLLFQIHFVYK